MARRTDRIDVRNEQTDRQTNADGETEKNGHTDRLTKEWKEGGRAGGRTDETEGKTDGWINGRMDWQADEGMDGLSGRTDGRAYERDKRSHTNLGAQNNIESTTSKCEDQ